jgi:hypothetical protein
MLTRDRVGLRAVRLIRYLPIAIRYLKSRNIPSFRIENVRPIRSRSAARGFKKAFIGRRIGVNACLARHSAGHWQHMSAQLCGNFQGALGVQWEEIR